MPVILIKPRITTGYVFNYIASISGLGLVLFNQIPLVRLVCVPVIQTLIRQAGRLQCP